MTHDPALQEVAALLGARLTRATAICDAHGHSEARFSAAPPEAVAFPETTAEVSAILKICAAHACPVVAWGTGTSLEGHALAIAGGISLDTSRMNKVLALHDQDMDVVVQPGLTREALNQDLRATGLFFPIDPGANASLGGMAATRASGTTAVRYGTLRDNVMALEVVLADGRIIRTGSRARKSSAGYDLTALFVGSEGTLGIITELTLRLHGQPEAISAATCAFQSVEHAVDTVIATIQTGIPMARIELLDTPSVRAVNAYSGTDLPEEPHLLLEFHGSHAGVAEQAKRFGEIAHDLGAHAFKRADKPEARTALWDMRHKAYYACLALRPGATALVTDVCVPISRLAQAIDETRADIEASPIMGPILGHVGDGNFHAVLLVEAGNEAELDIAKALSGRMVARAQAMGGTMTGEHGVGIGKRDYMAAEHGAGWGVMGDIKKALDPGNILNPGKLVAPR